MEILKKKTVRFHLTIAGLGVLHLGRRGDGDYRIALGLSLDRCQTMRPQVE